MEKALRDLTVRQRLALCDQLATFTPEQFDADSLCQGWRVRDVLGHLVSIVDLPMRKFAAFTAAGLDRAFDAKAREYGQRDPYELIALYRDNADHFMLMNPAGPYAYLSDVTTHCLDIAVPLDVTSAVLNEAKPVVLDALVTSPWYAAFGMKLFTSRRSDHVTLVATDIGWRHGNGPQVTATADQLILAITGRAVDPALFDGAGVPTFLSSSPADPAATADVVD